MKTQKSQNFVQILATVMNVKNSTPAGLSALRASILRGQKLTK